MTVKQIESLCGLSRANIRFYENEGLLQPRRLSNGYRDYSGEDLLTLKKICLLRQLHVPIEKIRELISDQACLPDVLTGCIRELEHEREGLSGAISLCRAIADSGASWQTLDADRYLSGNVSAQTPSAAPPAVRFDVARACPHPWRRFFARSLDFSLCELVWTAVLCLVLHVNPLLRSTAGQLLDAFVGLLLILFSEPLLLHFTGYTPGKLLFGLRVTCGGRKLSYFDALCRTGWVLASGLGLFIPIYSQIRLYKSYKRCKAGQALPWEEEYEYVLSDTALWRPAAAVLSLACLAALSVLCIFAGYLPPHRGDLTPAQFTQNFDACARYLGADFPLQLEADGSWSERFDGVIHAGALDSYPDVTFTLSENSITGIQLHKELVDSPIIGLSTNYSQIALVFAAAFVGAQPDAGVFSSSVPELADRFAADPLSSFSFELAGVMLQCDIQAQGYFPRSDPKQTWLFADEDASSQYFSILFAMTKTE